MDFSAIGGMALGLAIAAGPSPAHGVPAVWSARVTLASPEDASRLARIVGHFALDEAAGVARIETGARGMAALRAAGLAVEVDEFDTARIAGFLQQAGAPRRPRAVAEPYANVASCYRQVGRVNADMMELARHFPHLARVAPVGLTWSQQRGLALRDVAERAVPAALRAQWPDSFGRGARDGILALVLGRSKPAGHRQPRMVVTASLHAREMATAEIAMRFAEWLVRNYGTEPTATWLLDRHELHFIAHANPDGRALAERSAMSTGGGWRKNVNVADGYCSAAPLESGVDLNRNFSYGWNGSDGKASSSDPCDETYRGAAALSEAETRSIVHYIAGVRDAGGSYRGGVLPNLRATSPFRSTPTPTPTTTPTTTTASTSASRSATTALDEPARESPHGIPRDYPGLYLDLHSYGGWILWPELEGQLPADMDLSALAQRIAWHTRYRATRQLRYPVEGDAPSMFLAELGVPAMTLEIGKSFYEPCYEFERSTAPPLFDALRYAARTLHAPRLLARGPDVSDIRLSRNTAQRGQPVVIRATIDDDRYRYDAGLRGQPAVPRNRAAPVRGAYASVGMFPDEAGAQRIRLDARRTGPTVEVSGVVDTSGLAPGRHLLYVQGVGADWNYGPPDAVFIDITPPSSRLGK